MFTDNKPHPWFVDFEKSAAENALQHIGEDSWLTLHILKVPKSWVEATANKTYTILRLQANFSSINYYNFKKICYRDIHIGIHEYLRLINDVSERAVGKGDRVNSQSGGGIYHQDFTAVVQHSSVVQHSIPAARASVQKATMSRGTDKMAEIRGRLDNSK